MKPPKLFVPILMFSFLTLLNGCDYFSDPNSDGPVLNLNKANSNDVIYYNGTTEQGAEIVVQNPNYKTVSYLGFGKNGPLKMVEVERNGEWQILFWDWCATGAEVQSLSKGEFASFTIPIQIEKPVKVRVGVYFNFDNQETGEQIYTEEFTVE